MKELYHSSLCLQTPSQRKQQQLFQLHHPLPGHFPPSLSWVRWSNNSCLSCRWRICTKKTTLKGLFMLFPWSASEREHNGLVLSCQAQGTLLERPAGTSNELTALMFWQKMHNSWLSSTFFSVTSLCFSGCFYAFNEALHYKMQKFWMTIWVVEFLKKRKKYLV